MLYEAWSFHGVFSDIIKFYKSQMCSHIGGIHSDGSSAYTVHMEFPGNYVLFSSRR